jgi:hypothetical protein
MLSPQHYPQAKTFILEVSPLVASCAGSEKAQLARPRRRRKSAQRKGKFCAFVFDSGPLQIAICSSRLAFLVFDKRRRTSHKEIDFMRCPKRLHSRAEADFQLNIYFRMNIN